MRDSNRSTRLGAVVPGRAALLITPEYYYAERLGSRWFERTESVELLAKSVHNVSLTWVGNEGQKWATYG